MTKKSCKKGYYYCNTDKKCKKIPKGYHVMPTGYLMRDGEKHSDEEETKKKNGNGTNGNGNGNGDSSGNSDGGGVSEGWSAKYKKSIDCDDPKGFSQRAHCQGRKKVKEAKEYGDHEVSMAKSQVKQSQRNLNRIKKALRGKTDKDNLPAWLQAKLTDTEHNTDAAAGYMDEANKSGDSSLRDWFSKSSSSDGTPGWVQLGGKYAGKPCAKQPGQKTKPKCGSSKMARNLSDKEEESAFRRKNLKDKNPNRKGAPINVATEKRKKLNASYSDWRSDLEQLDELKCWKGYKRKAGSVPGEKGSCVKEQIVDEGLGKLVAAGAAATIGAGLGLGKMMDNFIKDQRKTKPSEYSVKGGAGAYAARSRTGGLENLPPDLKKRYLGNSYNPEGELVEDNIVKSRGGATDRIDIEFEGGTKQTIIPGKTKITGLGAKPKPKPKFGVDKTGLEGPKNPLGEEKDACYYKVKSRYKIWPSAYASGALVKCRKKGAKNWGNTSEGFSDWRTEMVMEGKLEDRLSKMSDDEFRQFIKGRTGPEAETFRQKRAAARASARPSSRPQGSGAQMPPDFAKQGVSSKPRTVNVGDYANRNVQGSAWQKAQQNPSAYRPGPGVKPDFSGVNPPPRPRSVRPNVRVRGGGKFGLIKALAGPALAAGASVLANVIANQQNKNSRAPRNESFENWKDDYIPTEFESVDIIKAEPLRASDWRTELNIIEKKERKAKKDYDGDGEIETGEEEYKGSRDKAIKKAIAMKEDWQKSNRNDGVDGMSQSSVNAYKRENPGSKLQTAVTEKNPTGKRAERRKNYCDRSNGQRKMHNIDCSKTPEKKICKARKRWRC